MTLRSNSRTERGRSESRLLEEQLICLAAAAEIFVSLVFLSVNRLFSLMETLTAVQLVFCFAAFQKKKKEKRKIISEKPRPPFLPDTHRRLELFPVSQCPIQWASDV